jgi:hypothetical protein
METEQMMARLLAEIRTGQEHMKDMMDANHAKADANLKKMLARMDTNKERMNECLQEKIISGQVEIRSTVSASKGRWRPQYTPFGLCWMRPSNNEWKTS